MAASQQACSTDLSNDALCAAMKFTPRNFTAISDHNSPKVGLLLTCSQAMPCR